MNETEMKMPQDNLVYVRPVSTIELPDEIREKVEGVDTLYAVHDSMGQRLALVKDRQMAFVLARQNDLAPVNVHSGRCSGSCCGRRPEPRDGLTQRRRDLVGGARLAHDLGARVSRLQRCEVGAGGVENDRHA